MSEYFRKYIRREHYPIHPTQLQFRTGFTNCVYDAFKRRHWKEWKENQPENDWDIFWADRDWIHNKMDQVHLKASQSVNHFRNHFQLTRKDLMLKNLKSRKRNLEKSGKMDEAAKMNFFPVTYQVPREYSIFNEEYKRQPNSL